MKIIVYILSAALLLPLFAGCGIWGNKKPETLRSGTANSQTESTTQASAKEVYRSLPFLGLPLDSGDPVMSAEQAFYYPTEQTFHDLTDIGDMRSDYDASLRMARLPQSGGNRFILTIRGGDRPESYIYSLSDSANARDRLQLSSVENVGERSVITQSFRIDNGYLITASKHLNGTLIERLTYSVDPNVNFREVRDGHTSVVAFDSYDGVNYIVQSFVWDYNTAGGLVKRDLNTINYRIDENGDLVRMEI